MNLLITKLVLKLEQKFSPSNINTYLYVRVQNIFCAHLLSHICVIVLLVYFILFSFIFWYYWWIVYLFSWVLQVILSCKCISRVLHLHVIVYMQGCIYVDPIYYLCISWFINVHCIMHFFCYTCQFVHLQWFAFKVYALHLIFKSLSASVIRADHPPS
jgi:hypothetical protein